MVALELTFRMAPGKVRALPPDDISFVFSRLPNQRGRLVLQLLSPTRRTDVGTTASSKAGCRETTEKSLLMPEGARKLHPGSGNTEQYETCS